MHDVDSHVRSLVKEMEGDFFGIFRHCHRYPELSFREFETTAYIKDILRKLDIDIVETPGLDTGAIGLLRGACDGPCIALRADIDALPVAEESSSEFPSENEGVMHACGHDTHYASLLGAAKVLSAMKNRIRGSVKFLFQPAEELNLGAKKMTDLGCLENPRVDAIFGLHNSPEIPVGTVAVKNGPLMAAVDRINLTVKGRGGHGGVPQRNADPIVAAAAVIQSLQTIVSRNVSPVDSAVVSVCNIQAGQGTTNNVTPDEVRMYGTVRSYGKQTERMLEKRIKEIVSGVSAAYLCEGKTEYIYDLPVTDNTVRPGSPDLYAVARKAVAGAGARAVDPEPSGGGEDFAVYVEGRPGRPGVPGFFYWLGVRNEAMDCKYSWHSPKFKADPACIPIGAGVYALSALHAMAEIAGKNG